MQKIILLLGAAALLGVGRAQTTQNMSTATVQETTSTMTFSDARIVPGSTTLRFLLQNPAGVLVSDSDLEVSHEKLLHVMVVKSDMSHYQHLHPEFVDGAWQTEAQFTKPGTYDVYADAVLQGGVPLLAQSVINVEGDEHDAAFPEASYDATVDGITAALPEDYVYVTGKPLELLFRLTDARGEAVNEIEPYLGACGHVVALRHDDPGTYIHAHPVTKEVTDGTVAFATSFHAPGTYTLFTQFKMHGIVRTFPITIEVAEGSGGDTRAHHLHH